MRDDLSPEFLAELEVPGRAPYQLAVFKFPSGDRFLSDREFEHSPGLYTEPVIESWGTLDKTASTANSIGGDGLPVSVVTLAIINMGPDWFSRIFSVDDPENVEVEIWQYFGALGDERYLIDRFVIQDNIAYSQSSLTVSLDLVSITMREDPYIGTLDPVTNEYFGVPIGSISGVPGTLYLNAAGAQGGQ